jgi:hypothetical protein
VSLVHHYFQGVAMYRFVICISCLAAMSAAQSAEAGVASRAIREAIELAGRKFGKEVAEEGAERLAVKMTQLAAKHGDDVVVTALKRVGPQAARIASEAGEHGGTALRLLGRYGDEAVPLAAKAASLKAVANLVIMPPLPCSDMGSSARSWSSVLQRRASKRWPRSHHKTVAGSRC